MHPEGILQLLTCGLTTFFGLATALARVVASDSDELRRSTYTFFLTMIVRVDTLLKPLEVSSIKKEKLHLNTFGNNKYQLQMCDATEVLIKKSGGSSVIKVEVLYFPAISTPL